MEELNHLLSELSLTDEMNTQRSRQSVYNVKVHKEILDNLYDLNGNLKLHLVRRAIGKMKKNG